MLTPSLKNDLHALYEINEDLLKRFIGDLETDEPINCHVVSLLADCRQALYAACVSVGEIKIADSYRGAGRPRM